MTKGRVDTLLPDASSATSLSLLDRLRARDSAAWVRLAHLYSPLVQAWSRLAGLQEADTADVCQEVFQAIAKHIGEFQRAPDGGSFRGWLRTITRTKIVDHWRAKRRGAAVGGSDAHEQLLQVPALDPGAASEPRESEEAQILYRRALELIVTDFGERTWKAFWMVVIENRRPVDVAADLGVSPNAVYLAKARVLARLREEFVGLIDD